ncbi:MAG: macrolide ABC transporter ATP-binding protein [Methanosphaera sp. rholeuAM74]|nr:MAG: macrolide ABC transporter ATP-binding protein [Methanosphaera sp. rholeuAM74]
MNNFIEFKNVTKEYKFGDNTLKAANNLNFTIDEGEFVVILGPSGSGKSTLLNLLGGLDNLTTGKIIVDNNEISSYNDKELTKYRAKSIGFIFQFYNLIPNLTAKENIELNNDILDRKVDSQKYLKLVDMEKHANQFPSELSGGEQQRVSIARALSKEPAMLLCDEPTGALDSKTGYNIIKLLSDLSRKDNTTVIIVTHNQDLAEIADKIIYLKNGIIEAVKINENPKQIDQLEW